MTDKTSDLFDLDALDTGAASDRGAEVPLVNPVTKKPIGIFIGIVGKHSQIFRDIVKDRTDSRLLREADNAKNGKESQPITAAETEDRAVELLTACTTHWRSETYDPKGKVILNEPVIVIKGEKLAPTIPNIQDIYRRFIWIREQVDVGVGDLGLFIKA